MDNIKTEIESGKGGLIANAWGKYRQMVVPERATTEQVRQLRMAFYGGATAILEVAKRVGEPDITEDEGVAVFSGVEQEAKAFRDGLGK